MNNRANIFAAIVGSVLLLLTASGNAWALMMASILGLIVWAVWFRRSTGGGSHPHNRHC